MSNQPKHRTFIWLEEFTVQYDMLVERYSEEVMEQALRGVLWGIATNPWQYDRVTAHIYQAKTRPLGLSVPPFKVNFGTGETDNEVVMMFIEEVTGTEGIRDL
jgi:NAD dependent epimerase/dehydratase family enzyme